MKLRMIIFAALLALGAIASFHASSSITVADGTDPMPFCRGKNCK